MALPNHTVKTEVFAEEIRKIIGSKSQDSETNSIINQALLQFKADLLNISNDQTLDKAAQTFYHTIDTIRSPSCKIAPEQSTIASKLGTLVKAQDENIKKRSDVEKHLSINKITLTHQNKSGRHKLLSAIVEVLVERGVMPKIKWAGIVESEREQEKRQREFFNKKGGAVESLKNQQKRQRTFF